MPEEIKKVIEEFEDVFTAERDCDKCGKPRPVRLVRNITANGISQVYWLCKFHNGAAGNYIQHDKLKMFGVNVDRLPVIENYSSLFQCAVCGELGAELHHWAPRYIFDDLAEKYPQSYLCHKHHMIWHELMTPEMNRRQRA